MSWPAIAARRSGRSTRDTADAVVRRGFPHWLPGRADHDAADGWRLRLPDWREADRRRRYVARRLPAHRPRRVRAPPRVAVARAALEARALPDLRLRLPRDARALSGV